MPQPRTAAYEAWAFFNGLGDAPAPLTDPNKLAALAEAEAQLDRAFGTFNRATGRRVRSPEQIARDAAWAERLRPVAQERRAA